MEIKTHKWEAKYRNGKTIVPYSIALCYNGEHNTQDDNDYAEIAFDPNEITMDGKPFSGIKRFSGLELKKIQAESRFTVSLKGNNRKQKRSLARIAVKDELRKRLERLEIDNMFGSFRR